VAFAGQNVVVLLDDSGSMNESLRSNPRVRKIDAAKRALLTVLEQVPSDAQVGVLALNGPRGNGEWILPLGPLETQRMQQAVQRITANGSTLLGRFMKTAADELLQKREEQRYGTYRLLIVTDGEANDPALVEACLPQILARGITVDVIGVDMQQDHSLKTRVSRYRRADDPGSLQEAIQESLAETPLDDQDPDEQSDFALLAALPDEIAEAAIQQLTEVNNQPILAEAAGEMADGGRVWPPGPFGQQPGQPPGGRRGSWFTWVILAMILVLGFRVIARMQRSR
jgi:uncharacterized protein YegL